MRRLATSGGAMLAAGIGLVLTLALFALVRADAQDDARARFERQADDARNDIVTRLHSYADVTYGLRALFSARGEVSRLEFHHYVASLDVARRFPGFQALNYARHVKGSELRALEDAVRRDTSLDPRGYPRFAVRPPGERPEHHVLLYLEPMAGNEFAHGLDIGVTDDQVRAQSRARDTGELTTAARLRDVGKEKQVALSMRLPIYRKGAPADTVDERRAAFAGTIGAAYNVRRLMADVLRGDSMKTMRVRLYDAGLHLDGAPGPHERVLLYDTAQTAAGAPDPNFEPRGDAGQRFEAALPMRLAGHDWEISFSAPQSAYLRGMDAWLPWLVLAAGLATSALLFAVLHSLASSRERALALAREITRDLRESEERIRELMRRLVTVQEAERRRVAAELHDAVGQSLGLLGIELGVLRGMLAGEQRGGTARELENMTRLVEDATGAVRRVMSDLRPPLLDDYGVSAAIEWHARQIEARTGLGVAFEGGALEPRPAPEVELALFRIAQEALTNAAKHAGASRVRVSLAGPAGRVRLEIEDDGRGLDPARSPAPKPHTGWGFAVMCERAEAVGGTLRIESPERGTRVVVEVESRDPDRPG